MTIPAVTPLPAISRTDPDFKAKVNAYWLTQVPAWTVACNAQALAVQTESDLVLGYRNAASASATTASNQVTLAANQAGIATAAAQTALNAPGTSSTSTTSLTIAAGGQTFTTQAGKAWAVGQPAIITRTSDPGTARMSGTITAYNTGTGSMSVLVDTVLGTGTFTDWTISLGTARAPDSLPIQIITANTTAVPGIHYLLAVGGITLTLPAALPAKDLCIAFSNVSGATTPAVDFNGHKLRGRTPGVMRLNSLDSRAMLQSTGNAAYGWA